MFVIFGYLFGFGFGYPISPNSIPVRVFCYFGSDFGSGFSDRVRMPLRISGKMPTPNDGYASLSFNFNLFILFLVH